MTHSRGRLAPALVANVLVVGLLVGLGGLLAGCAADHHHHPADHDRTDEAFESYFQEREEDHREDRVVGPEGY